MSISAEFVQYASRNRALTYFFSSPTNELIIFSELVGAVHVVTGASVFVWLGLEQGFTALELSAELNQHNNVALQGEIERLTTLFEAGCLAVPAADDKDQHTCPIAPLAVDAGRYRWHLLLGSAFTFTGDARLAESVCAALPVAAGAELQGKVLYHLALEPSATGYVLYLNNVRYRSGLTPVLVVPTVVSLVRQLAKQDSGFELAIHAASCAQGELGIVLPALSGSGKSTLSAALMAHGFQYLGDELALLDTHMRLLSLPLPLGIKRGSYGALARFFPALGASAELRRATGLRCKYLSVPATQCITHDRVAFSLLITPQFVAGAKPLLSPLSVTDSIKILFGAGCHTAGPLSSAYLNKLLVYLATIPRYKIGYGSTDDAIDLVQRVIAM